METEQDRNGHELRKMDQVKYVGNCKYLPKDVTMWIDMTGLKPGHEDEEFENSPRKGICAMCWWVGKDNSKQRELIPVNDLVFVPRDPD